MGNKASFSEYWQKIFASETVRKLIFLFSILVLFICAGMCFYYTLINAVDMPFDDEFDLFINPEMTANFNIHWLFPSQGEVKIVSTRILSWIFYHINGYNCISLIIFNFLLSCAGYFVLYKILRYSTKDFSLLPLLFIPFFSDVFWMNRLISFQSQVYFMLFFCYLAIYFGFIRKNYIAASVFVFLATISQSFVASLAIFIVLLFKEFLQNKFKNIKSMILPIIIVASGIIFSLSDISAPQDSNWTGYIYPNSLFFFRETAHLIVRGIFIERLSGYWDVIVAIFIILYLAIGIYKNKLYKSEKFSPLMAILGMYFTLLFADVYARGGYGLGILPWHFDFFVYIIPVLGAILYLLKDKKALLVYFLAIIFFHLPHFTRGYQTFKSFGAQNRENAQCVYDVVNELNNGICENVYYSKDLKPVINVAKKLNLHFVQTAKKLK